MPSETAGPLTWTTTCCVGTIVASRIMIQMMMIMIDGWLSYVLCFIYSSVSAEHVNLE